MPEAFYRSTIYLANASCTWLLNQSLSLGSRIWKVGAQPAVLFWEIVEPLGSGALAGGSGSGGSGLLEVDVEIQSWRCGEVRMPSWRVLPLWSLHLLQCHSYHDELFPPRPWVQTNPFCLKLFLVRNLVMDVRETAHTLDKPPLVVAKSWRQCRAAAR